MRRLTLSLLFGFLFAGAVGYAAESTKLSPHLTGVIRAVSPKFEPPPPTALPTLPASEAAPAKPEPPVDPDTIELPKFFVEDSKLSRVDPDKLLGKEELAAKQRREYRASLTGLEWALNCFNIPFLTSSVAARAQAKYENDRRATEVSRLGNLIDVASRLDPKAAAELRRELGRP